MKANIKMYEGKNERILATANVVTADGIEIRGFKIIKSSFSDSPVFYPPSYMGANGNSYNVVSNKNDKWEEIEILLSDEFKEKSQNFKKKLKNRQE